MSSSAHQPPLVVVAVDASGPGEFAIELAGSLTGTTRPELLGLFVENSLLLEHAGSRRAREILITGAQRALDRGALERQLRSQASRARARFEATSARLGLSSSFEIIRGDVIAEAIKRAGSARALVLGFGSSDSASPAQILQQVHEANLPLVLLAREGVQIAHSVAVVVDDPETATATLDVAARMANQFGSPLLALLGFGPGKDRSEMLLALEHSLREREVERSEIVFVEGMALAGTEQLSRLVRPRLLIVSSPKGPAETQALAKLLRRFPGALLVVRQ